MASWTDSVHIREVMSSSLFSPTERDHRCALLWSFSLPGEGTSAAGRPARQGRPDLVVAEHLRFSTIGTSDDQRCAMGDHCGASGCDDEDETVEGAGDCVD